MLAEALVAYGRSIDDFPCSLATMWTYVTEDRAERERYLAMLAQLVNRPAESLLGQVMIGPPDECAAVLRAYARAGIGQVFVWPMADRERQLERVMRDVAPLLID